MVIVTAGVAGYVLGRIGAAHRVPEIDPYLQRLAAVVDRRPAAAVVPLETRRPQAL